MTQNQQIENALRNGDVVTPLAALHRFGCLRLAGRIFDLRKKGLNIESVRDPIGKFCRYRLIK